MIVVVVAFQEVIPVLGRGQRRRDGCRRSANHFENLQNAGDGIGGEPGAVRGQTFLMGDHSIVAVGDDGTVGDGLLQDVGVGGLSLDIVSPQSARNRPLGNVGVKWGLLRG